MQNHILNCGYRVQLSVRHTFHGLDQASKSSPSHLAWPQSIVVARGGWLAPHVRAVRRTTTRTPSFRWPHQMTHQPAEKPRRPSWCRARRWD